MWVCVKECEGIQEVEVGVTWADGASGKWSIMELPFAGCGLKLANHHRVVSHTQIKKTSKEFNCQQLLAAPHLH